MYVCVVSAANSPWPSPFPRYSPWSSKFWASSPPTSLQGPSARPAPGRSYSPGTHKHTYILLIGLPSRFGWAFRYEGGLFYLMDDPLCCWSIRSVQDLSHEQRLQSSPDHPGNGAGFQAPHHVVTIRSWEINTKHLLLKSISTISFFVVKRRWKINLIK